MNFILRGLPKLLILGLLLETKVHSITITKPDLSDAKFLSSYWNLFFYLRTLTMRGAFTPENTFLEQENSNIKLYNFLS